jgi:hypothetical protein
MGEPSLNQGKIPREYAVSRVSGDRSPPTASNPSLSAWSGSGKSKKTGTVFYFFVK